MFHNRTAFCFVFCVSCFVFSAADSPSATESLTAHLKALKDTTTLHARFICTKNLAALETPLVSQGELWIKRGDRAGETSVRFSTEKPYTSELILTGGKVLARSQHETQWTTTNQSTRPGLSAVMSQLAGWSTGDPGKLTEMYEIKRGAVPTGDQPADVYILTPTNKDMLKAIKEITLTIDVKTHTLIMLRIQTQQDDTTEYHFLAVEMNKELPKDIFSPNTAPPATAPAGNKP